MTTNVTYDPLDAIMKGGDPLMAFEGNVASLSAEPSQGGTAGIQINLVDVKVLKATVQTELTQHQVWIPSNPKGFRYDCFSETAFAVVGEYKTIRQNFPEGARVGFALVPWDSRKEDPPGSGNWVDTKTDAVGVLHINGKYGMINPDTLDFTDEVIEISNEEDSSTPAFDVEEFLTGIAKQVDNPDDFAKKAMENTEVQKTSVMESILDDAEKVYNKYKG